jgi:diaminopimelate decarboxylase
MVRPQLPALINPSAQTLLEHHEPLLHDLVRGLGSPLHLMLPRAFDENAMAFKAALRESGVSGQVLYAKKANKAQCIVQRCPSHGLGVDAASLEELSASLAAGVPGHHIGISGPAKHPALLRLALQQECLVAVDSEDELLHVAGLASSLGRKARVLLRWRPPSQVRSRFGMDDAQLDEAVTFCAKRQGHLRLEGFSFHLSGYAIDSRARAAHELIDRCMEARRMGLSCDTIDIGGGFAVRYVDSGAWRDFLAAQAAQHYHANKSFEDFYPYASDCPGAQMLTAIFLVQHGQHTLAERMQAHGLRLLLEPGRALLDQAGITAFRVQGVKDKPAEGYGIVTVDGMSFSMSEQWFNSEYLPDPLLVSANANAEDRPLSAAVAGSSCLDSDMVSWRKLHFPRRPRPGDLLVYLNTAGYQMDSNESAFHELPLPRKVVVELDGTGSPHWRLDEVAAFSFPS